MALRSMTEVFEEDYSAKLYDQLRAQVRELVEYEGRQEAQLATDIDWNPTSLNRFMHGTIKTMPHHIAERLGMIYGEAEPRIREKKIAHAKALLESVGGAPNGEA